VSRDPLSIGKTKIVEMCILGKNVGLFKKGT
jgi:hypothetical protein